MKERLTKHESEHVISVNGKVYYDYPIADIVDRLAELEDKIEDGTLVELPCKVGDKFWYVNSYLDEPRIEEYQVKNFEICIYNILRIWVTETSCFIIDKNVCFSFAKAEKKLKELKGDNENDERRTTRA